MIIQYLRHMVQKLIPQLPTLENALNVLLSTYSMEKVYLFDVAGKLYNNTDSIQVDIQSIELCSDTIDTVLEVNGIYRLVGHKNKLPNNHAALDGDATDNGSLKSDINTTRVAEIIVGDGESSNTIGGDIQSRFTNDGGGDKILVTIISQGGYGVTNEELAKELLD